MPVKLLDEHGNPKKPEDLSSQNQATQDTQTISTEKSKETATKPPDEPKPARNVAYEAIIRDQQELIRKQNETLENLNKRLMTVEAGPPPDPKVANAKFWDSPVETVTELIRKEMRETVQPLTEQLTKRDSVSELDKIKNRLAKENPAYKEVMDKAGDYVDALVNKDLENGKPPSYENVRAAIIGIRGAIAMRMIDGIDFDTAPPSKQSDPNLAPTTTQGSDTVTIPPHVRPTAPRIVDQSQGKKITMDDLTENERRLCKEQNMTAEDYIYLRDDITPLEVTSVKLPSEKGK